MCTSKFAGNLTASLLCRLSYNLLFVHVPPLQRSSQNARADVWVPKEQAVNRELEKVKLPTMEQLYPLRIRMLHAVYQDCADKREPLSLDDPRHALNCIAGDNREESRKMLGGYSQVNESEYDRCLCGYMHVLCAFHIQILASPSKVDAIR